MHLSTIEEHFQENPCHIPTRVSRQGLGQFSPLMKKPAAAGFHRDQAEEVGSHLASAAAFSALRSQVISRKAAIHQVRASTTLIVATDSPSRSGADSLPL